MSDPRQAQIEKECRDLGDIIKRGIGPKGMGFALFVFDYGEEGFLAYVASAVRADIARTIVEWVAQSDPFLQKAFLQEVQKRFNVTTTTRRLSRAEAREAPWYRPDRPCIHCGDFLSTEDGMMMHTRCGRPGLPPPEVLPSPRCQCTMEAGDSECPLHPTCPYCGDATTPERARLFGGCCSVACQAEIAGEKS